VYGETATATPARLLLSAERLAWAGTACGVLGAVLLSIRAVLGNGGGAASVPLLVAACVCFGYAVACYGLAYARRAGAFLVRRRPPGEDERAVWYCERCNAVFTERAG
jgi:drug/metabolite transporter (DMT)-like permease